MTRPSSRILAPSLSALAAALLVAACGSEPAKATPSETEVATAEGTAAPAASQAGAAFDPATVPLSDKDLGDFPHIAAPQGYVAQGGKTVELEQKYILAGGAVRVAEGRYHHADLFVADGGTWNETGLLRALETRITALGGVRVFDGRLPEAAATMIRENEPKFVGDLYDPWPYRFRQYLIRTERALVWIEVGYGYNAEMVDLTVVEEPVEGSPAA